MTTLQDWVGRTETRADSVWPPLVRGLAASLGLPPPPVLPPLWHWLLFQEWAPPEGLGPDGHPRRGGFLPAVHDLPRRMWAGGRVSIPGALRPGDPVARTSTILRVAEKQGGSGRLVFVTVGHVISGPSGVAVEEEHDIVYRGTQAAAVRAAAPAAPAPPGAVERVVHPDPVLLFRYSALTGNAHRIHYDLDYVRREEGYPGLVVHGPLQATWLAGLATELRPGAPLRRFAFRGRRPAFADRPVRLQGWAEGDDLRLRALDDTGAVTTDADASFGEADDLPDRA